MVAQHDELLNRLQEQVSHGVTEAVKKIMSRPAHRELAENINKIMDESDFYCQINEEMCNALQDIRLKLAAIPANEGANAWDSAKVTASHTRMLFTEVTRQIEEIMLTTLGATVKIMAAAELLLEQQTEAGAIISALGKNAGFEKELDRLDQLNQSLSSSLTGIITELSFQDLTGQRLEKVALAVGAICAAMPGHSASADATPEDGAKEPEKELSETTPESGRTTADIKKSQLKGPTMDASQSAVDDILTDFGI